MTDRDPKRAPSKTDFDTLKLAAASLEEKRVSADRAKTIRLKAARLEKIEKG